VTTAVNQGRLRRLLAAGCAAASILAVGPAVAQPFQPLAAKPVDTDRRNGAEYGAAFAQMRDWNGVWAMVQPAAMFDISTAENIDDGNEGGDFGIIAGGRERPPYKPEYEKLYTERVRRSKELGINEDTVANCRVQGMPRVYSTPQDVDIVVLPKVTFMIWSQFGNVRHIYTDGRKHLDPDKSAPTDMGHSVGHWEGATMVVDTVSMLPGNYDQSGPPYSDKLHIVERISMQPNSRLQIDMTVEDPVMLTRPWHVVREMQRVRITNPPPAGAGPGPTWSDVEMVYCTNNRNATGANGGQSVQLMSDLKNAPPGSVDSKPLLAKPAQPRKPAAARRKP
jgi:hypothetical protein